MSAVLCPSYNLQKCGCVYAWQVFLVNAAMPNGLFLLVFSSYGPHGGSYGSIGGSCGHLGVHMGQMGVHLGYMVVHLGQFRVHEGGHMG